MSKHLSGKIEEFIPPSYQCLEKHQIKLLNDPTYCMVYNSLLRTLHYKIHQCIFVHNSLDTYDNIYKILYNIHFPENYKIYFIDLWYVLYTIIHRIVYNTYFTVCTVRRFSDKKPTSNKKASTSDKKPTSNKKASSDKKPVSDQKASNIPHYIGISPDRSWDSVSMFSTNLLRVKVSGVISKFKKFTDNTNSFYVLISPVTLCQKDVSKKTFDHVWFYHKTMKNINSNTKHIKRNITFSAYLSHYISKLDIKQWSLKDATDISIT
jgi:hypothetical protein